MYLVYTVGLLGSVMLFKGSAPAEKSETDEMTGGTKSDEREKVGTPEVSSPPPIQSPGVETNLDFVKYTCDTRKTAMKEGDIITISSVTQSRVKIDGFTSGRNMLGKAQRDLLTAYLFAFTVRLL